MNFLKLMFNHRMNTAFLEATYDGMRFMNNRETNVNNSNLLQRYF